MSIPPTIAKIIRTVAPTLAGALTGPFAGLAAGIVTVALRKWLPEDAMVAVANDENAKATPDQIVAAVAGGMNDQRLIYDLQRAEADLKAEEKRLPFRFAQLEVQDRESARSYTKDTGLSRPQFFFGMGIVVLAFLMLFGIIAGCIMALTGTLELDPAQAPIAIAAFGVIGTIVGVFQGAAVQVLSFYFGSSAGSKDKTDQIGNTMRDLGDALADNAKTRPAPLPLPPPTPPPVVVVPQPTPGGPSAPPVVPEGEWQQGPFGGQRWRLTDKGVVVEGQSKPQRTVGTPATVKRIWSEYGPLIAASCAANAVPLEIVVACIATESAGKPRAMLVEPDKRVSVGLMQTLTGTASEMMGRTVTAMELNDPALSIEAGTRYIASQRPKTRYQPPLVAAAYNAGSLRKAREQDDNPWNLASTGDHINRFCQFFGDACAVAAEERWSHGALAPVAGP